MKPRQVAVLLDYDVAPDAIPTRYDRGASPSKAGMPGYCEHGNVAPECRICRRERQPEPSPDTAPEPERPRRRLRRVV